MPSETLANRVEAIPGTPLPFGLLSAATVLESVDPHDLNGVTWVPLSCAEAKTTDWCSDDPEFDYTKDFDRTEAVFAPAVTVYYGRDCGVVGETFAEAEAYVRAGLAIGEPRALEQWVWENVLLPIAVDHTGPSALGVAAGIGVIEGELAADYGGVGVLHVPAKASALLARDHQMYRDGARMVTWLGNLTSLGAGYTSVGPGDVVAPDGTAWIFASGPITIRREAVDMPGDSDGNHVNIVTNDRVMLAERTSVVGVECGVHAILIDLEQETAS